MGEDKPYANIKVNQWQQVGNAMVYYLQPKSSTIKDIFKLIVNTPHQLLYLNSFFDSFTVMVLLIRKIGWVKFKPVIVAPRGEFGWGSLRLKYPKKYAYIHLARLFGFYKEVIWKASSEYEALDIIKVLKIQPDEIHIALDLSTKIISDMSIDVSAQSVPNSVGLRIVFLSRIAREKNMDFALRVLNRVKARVVFDIYGPAENEAYWKECQELISQLPSNVIVNYHGSVFPNDVVHIFSHYDLFLFPTAGENYGHVIVESLTAGTPVLISDKTPWRNLQADELGWDVDLLHMDSFVDIIEKLALMSYDERLNKRAIVKAKIRERLLDPAVLEANRQLFKELVLR